jgi:5-methylcytosine-specific restriction endonuclease McrA
VDSWREDDGARSVFKFKLIAVEGVESDDSWEDAQETEAKRSRVIPTNIKLEVWQRDKGKCVECGASDELHFDHILPFSKGGTSTKSENVQLLCARHNLQKSAKIQ